jgi:hypothetical protein
METSNYIKLNPNDLWHFCGTEHHYFMSPFQNLVYTDGVQYLANHYKMYWLITDIAAFLPKILKSRPDSFYCLILKQTVAGEAELIFTDGNNETPIFSYKYDCTSLQFAGYDKAGNPIQEMKLFLQQTQGKQGKIFYCLMLPSEY